MGRKEQVEEAKGDDGFAVMFTALNLILLSFFILLNALSVKDNDRKKKALGSLRGSFGILEGGENVSREGQSLLRTDRIEAGASERLNTLMSETNDVLRRAGLFAGTADVVLVPTADGLRIELADRVLFQPGRTELNPRAFTLLDEVAKLMVRINRAVVIRGYADPAKPARFPTNVELSATRATRVARYMVEAAKMPPRLVVAEGRGVKRDKDNARYVELLVAKNAFRARLAPEPRSDKKR